MKILIDGIANHGKRLGVKNKNDGEWYNCWATKVSLGWAKGQEIDFEVEEREYKGRKSKEIILPKEDIKISTKTPPEYYILLKEVQSLKEICNRILESVIKNELSFPVE